MLRAATTADTAAVTALLGELGHPDERDVAARVAAWNDDPAAELTVVEDDRGALVGLVAVIAQRSFHRAEPARGARLLPAPRVHRPLREPRAVRPPRASRGGGR